MNSAVRLQAPSARVLIVEDESIVAFNLSQRLSRLGYHVLGVAASCEEALDSCRESPPDVVLMDIRIQGDVDGIETASRLQQVCAAPVIYLTAHSEDSMLDRARATHPYGYLLKPFSEREMHATIQMALEHFRAEQATRASEERLRLALDAAEMGVWDLDPASGTVALEGRSVALLGLPEGRRVTDVDALLDFVEPEHRERVRRELAKCGTQSASCDSEFQSVHPDGARPWLRAQARASSNQHVMGVLRDVTQRKRVDEELRRFSERLEREVADRTRELEATVRELDAFSYSVAHDLRAPARAIVGFCQIVLDENRETLADDVLRHLGRIHSAGLQMSRLVDALLELSRVRRAEMSRKPLDLSALAGAIAAEIAFAEPGRSIGVSIAPGLTASGDRDLIRIVLENLLRNAWKFTSQKPLAHIEVGSMREDGEEVFFVRDDGAGFDMSYVSKLFQAFERLHAGGDFPGTGIGLATVQRIVQRHGGRVWAEGVPQRGATFYFTLPPPPTTP